MTLMGEVKGQLLISPNHITFDPILCNDNKSLIPVLFFSLC